MKIAWRFLLAMMATLGLGGCRALSTGSLLPNPRPLAERAFDVDAFVAEHNRNVETEFKALEAKPDQLGRKAHGRSSMAGWPWSARVTSSSNCPRSGPTKADIGSNDEEFWFWVGYDKDKSIYWCNYEDLESSTLCQLPISPTGSSTPWALKAISPEEAAGIQVRTKALRPGTIAPGIPDHAERY